ncbi:KaiC 1, partial [bacterium]
ARLRPRSVIIDPVTTFLAAGSASDAEAMLMRLVDYLKAEGITGFFTSLTHAGSAAETSSIGLSSLMDTWLLVRDIESNGERNRGLYVIKSRGMNHSNQVREFLITGEGVQLREVYVGPEGLLTGSARTAQSERERNAALLAQQESAKRRAEAERRIRVLKSQVLALQADIEAETLEIGIDDANNAAVEEAERFARLQMARARGTGTSDN